MTTKTRRRSDSRSEKRATISAPLRFIAAASGGVAPAPTASR